MRQCPWPIESLSVDNLILLFKINPVIQEKIYNERKNQVLRVSPVSVWRAPQGADYMLAQLVNSDWLPDQNQAHTLCKFPSEDKLWI